MKANAGSSMSFGHVSPTVPLTVPPKGSGRWGRTHATREEACWLTLTCFARQSGAASSVFPSKELVSHRNRAPKRLAKGGIAGNQINRAKCHHPLEWGDIGVLTCQLKLRISTSHSKIFRWVSFDPNFPVFDSPCKPLPTSESESP